MGSPAGASSTASSSCGSGSVSATSATGESGGFTIRDLIVGENYMLTIGAEGYEDKELTFEPLTEESLSLDDIILSEIAGNDPMGMNTDVPANNSSENAWDQYKYNSYSDELLAEHLITCSENPSESFDSWEISGVFRAKRGDEEPFIVTQLDDGGRLVLPVGKRYSQVLQVWKRKGSRFSHETTTAVAFVPLIGAEGWDENNWDRKSFW